jgi:zinc transporter, ZIP family
MGPSLARRWVSGHHPGRVMSALACPRGVSIWSAVFWGAFASAALYIGEALAGPMRDAHRATGLIMAFGSGTLLSAVAYELVPETSLKQGVGVAAWFIAGALVYYVGDRLVDGRGGAERQRIGGGEAGSGAAMFLGAPLDGVPESFILGIGLSLGGSVSVAFVTAVFVSNIPQGVAGTASLQAAGTPNRRIFVMWTLLTIACAATAAIGFAVGDSAPHAGLDAQAFAGGAVLTMLTDSMVPEAFSYGGRLVGLATVLGYLVAAGLTIAG